MPRKKKTYWDEDLGIYDEEFVEELLEDDEISPAEEGFMMGYNEG